MSRITEETIQEILRHADAVTIIGTQDIVFGEIDR